MSQFTVAPWNMANLQGAVGDLMRASYAAGMAEQSESSSMTQMGLVIHCVGQLLALCLQREPTPEEVAGVVGQ